MMIGIGTPNIHSRIPRPMTVVLIQLNRITAASFAY